MEKLEIGKNYQIHSYKHNGELYKSWDEAVLLHFNFQEGIIIFGNNSTIVTEKDGHHWQTKEPAILFFFTNKWYNIIGQYKKRGIYYYCNIASPIIIEDHTIKYIDYDLDVKVFPNGSFKVLDKNEYNYHKEKYNYGENLDLILQKQLNNLIEKVKNKDECFDNQALEKWVNKYLKIKKEVQNQEI